MNLVDRSRKLSMEFSQSLENQVKAGPLRLSTNSWQYLASLSSTVKCDHTMTILKRHVIAWIVIERWDSQLISVTKSDFTDLLCKGGLLSCDEDILNPGSELITWCIFEQISCILFWRMEVCRFVSCSIPWPTWLFVLKSWGLAVLGSSSSAAGGVTVAAMASRCLGALSAESC